MLEFSNQLAPKPTIGLPFGVGSLELSETWEMAAQFGGGCVSNAIYPCGAAVFVCVLVLSIVPQTNEKKRSVLWVAAASPLFVSNSALLCVEHTRACVVPVENDIAFITVPGGR